jgi:inner membrane protein
MPSTLVHVAFASLLAAALLGETFDRRAVLVVMGLTALPDLDAFVALFSTVGHRTAMHTFVLPFALGVLLWVDTRVREESFVRERWDDSTVSVAWIGLVGMAVAGIGLDFIEAGVNPLWPLHDQFYVLNGKVELSDQRGLVQTFVDIETESDGGGGGGAPTVEPESLGSSEEVNMSTGVDPDPDNSEEDPERVFPIVRAGWQLHLMLTGFAVTAARLWRERE